MTVITVCGELVIDLIRIHARVPANREGAEHALRTLRDKVTDLVKKTGVDGGRGLRGLFFNRSKSGEHD